MANFRNLVQTSAFLATLITSSSALVAQEKSSNEPASPAFRPASATSVAGRNSIAVSIAINGEAIAEAEDGAEALATAINDALGNAPRQPAVANQEPQNLNGGDAFSEEADSARPAVSESVSAEEDRADALSSGQSNGGSPRLPKLQTREVSTPQPRSKPVAGPVRNTEPARQYQLRIHMSNGRVAVLTLNQEQLECLLKRRARTSSPARSNTPICRTSACH